MSLVQYSDSEGSDDEQPQVTPPAIKKEQAPQPDQKFSSIVDRGNPRKIRVALPEIKSETTANDNEGDEDGPARKKPRTAGGGLFSGFNSMLPAPKRPNPRATSGGNAGASKAFSLKTGAGPGFDRQADAEWRHEQALNPVSTGQDSDTIPKPGSLRNDKNEGSLLKEDEYKKKGNAMIFRPLSVARNAPKKKSAAFVAARASPAATTAKAPDTSKETIKSALATDLSVPATTASAPPLAKPKVSLFSFSSEDKAAPIKSASAYESIVYNPKESDETHNTEEDLTSLEYHNQASTAYPIPSTQQQSTLDTIADDLNLSRSQRRQLMGRNPGVSQANSRILNFNTDSEYAANQEMLTKASQEELAAQQHNPVRAISSGKHSLRQLVQAASSQKDALEESFAAGRRNKKEAGSRYGW
jgi:Mitotic checkpoint regulator, MAD2B-interacting